MSDRGQAPQADPILYWNGPGASRWVTDEPMLDRVLEPFGRAVLERAAVSAGERVVDIGCGCGATTLALAAAVGTGGQALGVDVSAPMLARARERGSALPQASFTLADATTHRVEPPADLVFSRFGVMFFVDPVAAMANLRGMLRPGGRLAFVCWRSLAENPWANVPFAAVSRVLGTPPTPLDAAGPGPFAFADPARVRGLLEGAGFAAVAVEAFDQAMWLGEDVEQAVEFCLVGGPASRLLADASDAVRALAREAVRAELAPLVTSSGIALGAATWLVTALRA